MAEQFIKFLLKLRNFPYLTRLPLLIYGVEPANIHSAQMIEADARSGYRVAGFISPSPDILHRKISGKPVYFKDNFYNSIRKFHYVKAILIRPEELSRAEKHLLAGICFHNKIELLAVPSPERCKGKKNIREIQPATIEDLLGRSPIEIDFATIGENLKGKGILVTGAAGSVGSEMVSQLCRFDPGLLLLCDIAETPLHRLGLDLKNAFPDVKFKTIIADIRNKDKMEYIFSTHRPHYVYHAAAYKHVPMMESHPDEAVLTNVMGSKIVADLAVAYGTECFIMISSDKAVNPSSVMGASKRIAEIYIQALSGHLQKESKGNPPAIRFITARFGNVLGSGGSVVPLFEKQIREGGPVTVTDIRIIRYFMTIPEACGLVLEASNLGKGGEIFIFDMGDPVRIKDMAEEMIRLSGYKPCEEIEIQYTGLRPGEKLFEELLYDRETCKPTKNRKIRIVTVCEQDIHKVLPLLNRLFEVSHACNNREIIKVMKQIVPEFTPYRGTFR
ncbi:MAG: polysaccharide biosynthesis protein [Dysgonamonadaceae bacterium]|jgi:FlaA1/EpsC-like NDP-sugar epimerase|nr:polysaccharide biosynthesis protein [Dysgonamonadaceae bacterium]